jgi:hypothetical protein
MERAKEIEVKTATPTELIRDESESLKMSFFKANKASVKTIESSERPKTSCSDDISVGYSKALKIDNLEKSENTCFKIPENPPINSKSTFSFAKSSSAINSQNDDEKSSCSKSSSSNSNKSFKPEEKRKLSALDEIITMEEKKREKHNRKDYWLHKVNKWVLISSK